MYAKNELYKLNHSLQGKLGILIIGLLALFLSTTYIKVGNAFQNSFLSFPMYLISNIQNIYILIIISIIATTFLFDREFQDRTYIYIFIRPVSWVRLLIDKIIASYLYIIELLCGITIFSIILGLLTGNIKPCSSLDTTLISSFIRVFGYFIITSLSFIFIISLTSLISINCRNQIGSIITTLILFFIIIILIIAIFKESNYSFTPFYYLFFSQYISELTVSSIIKIIFKGLVILLIYSIIPFFLAYKIGNKIRKGEKNV